MEEIDTATIRALRTFDKTVVQPNQMQLLERAFSDFEFELRDVYSTELQAAVRVALNELIDRGAEAAGLSGGLGANRVTPNQVVTSVLETTKYYVRNHVTRNIMPRVAGLPEKAVAEGLDGTTALRRISGEIDQIVGSQHNNLRITANQAASRAYHYGVMKGGWEAGYRYYEFEAILDERTSVVCENLNGKVFQVADALDKAERAAFSSPEDLRANAPWFKPDQVTGLDQAALVAIGANLPPLHAFCRSSVRFVGSY